jgi:hypothetical protein
VVVKVALANLHREVADVSLKDLGNSLLLFG